MNDLNNDDTEDEICIMLHSTGNVGNAIGDRAGPVHADNIFCEVTGKIGKLEQVCGRQISGEEAPESC